MFHLKFLLKITWNFVYRFRFLRPIERTPSEDRDHRLPVVFVRSWLRVDNPQNLREVLYFARISLRRQLRGINLLRKQNKLNKRDVKLVRAKSWVFIGFVFGGVRDVWKRPEEHQGVLLSQRGQRQGVYGRGIEEGDMSSQTLWDQEGKWPYRTCGD